MAVVVAKPWARQQLGYRARHLKPSHSPLDYDLAVGAQPCGQAVGTPRLNSVPKTFKFHFIYNLFLTVIFKF